MEEYIKNDEFATLLEDINHKLTSGEIEECKRMLDVLIEDTGKQEKYIDRTYISKIKEKKRMSKIADINRMLSEMTMEQIDNVHSYTSDEYDEPNHEAEALEAIVKLSKKING